MKSTPPRNNRNPSMPYTVPPQAARLQAQAWRRSAAAQWAPATAPSEQRAVQQLHQDVRAQLRGPRNLSDLWDALPPVLEAAPRPGPALYPGLLPAPLLQPQHGPAAAAPPALPPSPPRVPMPPINSATVRANAAAQSWPSPPSTPLPATPRLMGTYPSMAQTPPALLTGSTSSLSPLHLGTPAAGSSPSALQVLAHPAAVAAVFGAAAGARQPSPAFDLSPTMPPSGPNPPPAARDPDA